MAPFLVTYPYLYSGVAMMHFGSVSYLVERRLTLKLAQAVFARCLSSLKQERGRASKLLDGPKPNFSGDKKEFLANLEQALYASKIISYAQGFMLIQNVSCFLYERASSSQNTHLSFRLQKSTNGNSTNLPSLSCGAEAALSDLFS